MSGKRKRLKALTKKIKARKQSQREKTSLARRVLKVLPLMILGLLFVFYLNRAEYDKLGVSFLDVRMRLEHPDKESDVVIVEITQKDFDGFFEGQTRPLNPPKLHELITAVSKGKPCVIGVDIDTHFAEFGAETFAVQEDKWSPVVWAREIKEIPQSINEKPIPLNVLGGQDKYNSNSGIPLLIDDESGVTRRYTRMIETQENTVGKKPSFAWAVYREAASRCLGIDFPDMKEIKKREEETSPLFIKYSRGHNVESVESSNENAADKSAESVNRKNQWKEAKNRGRIKIPASQIINLSKSKDWQNNNLIKNKIVLIGGTYLNDDVHETPLGRMSGVEITANVIETELDGGGIKQPGFLTIGLLSLFHGFLIIGLFQLVSWEKALLISLPVVFIISLACSFL
ncbi:MAG TPA: CHASE2 domain-containing protein, partial [Pyrinomonadaceae bacterium]|nr:CHASE2 domain-containing protein [Pyrinomonadaceae bacterium]